jgi:two-component system CheB/CheR fusion protein
VTCLDVDRVKRAELLAASRAFAQSIVQTVKEPLAVLDASLRVVSANRAFLRTFLLSDDEAVGRSLLDIGHGCFALPGLGQRLSEVVSHGRPLAEMAAEYVTDQGPRRLILSASRLEGDAAETGHALLVLSQEGGRQPA